MSYQVIARKWRPQRFEDVTGQQSITRTLQNAIKSGRLHHAYLFSGPRGCGKTTTARILAKALNCLQGTTAEPCGECPSCQEIAQGGSLDVLELDAASNTGVDNIRDAIINTIAINPARDRYKIFIIDEVHMLSMSAFNALLKTLEEPPPHAVFILATTELHKVPQTILSRCQQFEFRTIVAEEIAKRLRLIANAENITVSDSALLEVALAGQGSMRDAQSAFDQVISFAGATIEDDQVREALGIINQQTLVDFTTAIAERNERRLIELVAALAATGYDLRQFCRDLMVHFRNLLVLKTAGYERELLPIVESELPRYRAQAEKFSSEDLVRFFQLLTTLEQELKQTTQPRFQLEIGVIKLAQMSRLQSLDEILQRLQALEARFSSPLPSLPPPHTPSAILPSSSSPTSKRELVAEIREEREEKLIPKIVTPAKLANSPPPEPPREDVEPEIEIATPPAASVAASGNPIERLKTELENRRRMMLLTALDQATRMELQGDRLIVQFGNKATEFYKKAASKESRQFIVEAAQSVFGKEIKVEVSLAGADTTIEEDKETLLQDQMLKKAENDPIVQSFVKKFKGELSVRRRED
ncbi:MAG: DNA polymerase III subunit gamma/tau [Acidobacteriota bacterium]